VVLLNAAAALVAGDLAGGLADGLVMARASIDGGRASERLARMVTASSAA
jgi:anthranilate phosphoribosyltransferase